MMKKIFLLVAFFVLGKMWSYAQYPITQNIGSDSTIVVSKGALQSRLINVTYPDTATANLQRIRQYPGAQIATTSGGINLWIRNATATAWLPINTGSGNNIYTIDGTLTGNRTLTGNNYSLTFTGLSQFLLTVGNQTFTVRSDSASLTRKLSYASNRGSTFTLYSLVDKNYVDSAIASSPAGTVTQINTNNNTGITGGPITSTGTLAIDTLLISTRAWRQKGVDSLQANINLKLNIVDTTGMLANYVNSVGYGLGKTSQTVYVDSASLSNYYLRRKDSLTATNPLGYVTQKILADTAAAIRSSDLGGTVTSVATNNGTGITGGTITTSGTLAIDTTVISTRAWRQKGVDSLQANINLKLNISDTASMLSPYLRKADTTSMLANYVNNVGYGLSKAGQVVSADSATLSAYYLRRKDSLTTTNPLGYVTKKILSDTAAAIRSADAGGTVTSVGLTMPAAFAVAGSPITTSGTFAVTGAGLVSQYIRGDGTLANFPGGGGGGGSSVSYYLNGSVNQGTFVGNTYYQMSKTPNTGASANFTIGADGYIAQFITDAGDPSLLNIPAGNWNFELYFSASSAGGNPQFYVELYKYNGTAFTLISSGSSSPESITGGTVKDLYLSSLAVPATSLTLTDRLAVRIYIIHDGRTITLYTQNGNLCQIITTFTTGITALNSLTAQVQYLTTGTSGTDFNISSVTDTHTFNLPVASATNTGKLSSTDWSTFNNKVGGSLVSGYITKATGTNTIDTSQLYQSSGLIGIGTTSPTQKLQISGNAYVNGQLFAGDTALSTYQVEGILSTPYVLGRKAVDNTLSTEARPTGIQGHVVGRGSIANRLQGGTFYATTDSASTANSTGSLRGITSWSSHNGSGSLTTAWGGYNIVQNKTTGTITNAYGSVSGVENRGATSTINKLHGTTTEIWNNYGGTIDTAFGQVISIYNNNAASNIGAVYGLSIGKGLISASGGTHYWRNSGTIGTSYGLYLDSSIDVGTTKYALFSNSNSNSYFRAKLGVGTTSPDSAFQVATGAYFQRGIRASGLPQAAGTKALRIDANGTLSVADTLVDAGGTVTSVATNNGTGITGGTITTTGTLAIDTLLVSTRAWRQKGIDSVQANLTAGLATKLNISDTAAMLSPYARTNVVNAALATKLNISDTASMLNPYLRKVDTTAMLSPYKTFYPRTAISLTTTGSSGAATYNNSTGVLNIPVYTDAFTGTVTSVATNTGTGITGGTITTTGTLAIDTLLVSTRAWRQKGVDSLQANINQKLNISDTASMLSPYLRSNVASATYVPQTRTITINGTSQDLSANRTYNVGTVTSVATNTGTGITGGTITSSGTIAADTLLLSTRAWRQKGIDSVAALINSNVSGTTNYVAKFTGTNTIGNSQLFDNGTNVGIGTTSPAALLNIVNNGGKSTIAIGNTASSTYSQLLMYGGATKYNWSIGAQYNVNNALEITPSTAVEGTTFSTPVVTILQSGNVGIGTTSPTQKLDVNGIARVSTSDQSTNRFRLYNQNSGQTWDIVGGLNGANNTDFSIFDGTNTRLVINPSGNVGIGTTSPAYKLDINGTARIDGSANLIMTNTANTSGFEIGLLGGTSDATSYIYQRANSSMAFGTNNTERMRISSTGAVRLNAYGSGSFTGTPAYNLSVDASGNIIETPGSVISGTGTTNYIPKFTSSSAIGNSIVQDYGDNVWVGTNTAGYGTLNIQRFTSAPYATLTLTDQATASNEVGIYLRANGSNPVGISSAGAPIAFYTGGPGSNERMRLTSGGSLGIGTSSPSEKLDVYDNSASNVSIKVGNTSGALQLLQGNGAAYLYTATNQPLIFSNNNSEKMRLDASGNLIVGGTSASARLQIVGSFGSQLRIQETGGTYFDIAAGGRFDLKNAAGTTIVSIAQSGSPVGTQLNLDASGNLGLGVTPSPWNLLTAFQIKNASISGYQNSLYVSGNAYYDFAGGGWKYIANDGAALFDVNGLSGQHRWFTAGSGTANAAISWTQAMTLFSTGNLAVGGTSDNGSRLNVTGAATFSSSVTAGSSILISNTINAYAYQNFGANSGYGWQIGKADNSTGLAPSNGFYFYDLTNSATRMVISQSGNVGIGTTNPLSRLHVNTGTNQNFRVRPGTDVGATNGIALNSRDDADGTLQQLSLRASDVLMLVTGNVGIGTTSPGYKLHIVESGAVIAEVQNSASTADARLRARNSQSYLEFGQDGTGGYIQQAGAYPLITYVNGSERMRITSGGLVGIGSSSPDEILRINGTNSATSRLRIQNNGTNIAFLGSYSGIVGSGNANDLLLSTGGNDNLAFGINTTEKMRITSGGDVGIGTTSPTSAISGSAKVLAIVDNTTANLSSVRVYGGSSTTSLELYGGASEVGLYGSTAHPMVFSTNSSERMRITSGGELLINTTSDAGDYKLQVNGAVLTLGSGGIYAVARRDNNAYAGGWYSAAGNITLDMPTIGNAVNFDVTTANATFGGSIKTAAPSGGTAQPWKLGSAGVTLGGSNLSGVEVEINGTTYYLVTGYLPEPEPDPAAAPTSGPSGSYKTYNKPTPVKSAQDAKIQKLEKEVEELKEMIKALMPQVKK